MTCPSCGAVPPFTVVRYDPVTHQHQPLVTWWCTDCLRAKVDAALAAVKQLLEAHA